MALETVNKLYLELSQVTTAKTARELALEKEIAEHPAGSLTREDIDRMTLDSARFRWLTNDHADPDVRAACREILGRMGVMSYAAACAAIDGAIEQYFDRT